MKILAIDDNRDNLTTLRAVLRDAFPDTEVFTALDGPKGIALALAEDPDVILLDIVMPGMDGFEVCRRLKKDDAIKHVPVVFLTALKTDRGSRIRALNTGAEAFVAKPIDQVELMAQVRAMARIKAAHVREQTEKERLAALVTARTQQVVKQLKKLMAAQKDLIIKEKAIESSQNAIALAGMDGNVTYVNPAFLQMWGYENRDEVLGKPSISFWMSREKAKDVAHRSLKTGRWEGELLAKRKDGSTFTALVSANLVSDEQGKPMHKMVSMVDMSERKKAEEERRIIQDQLHQAQKMESVGRLAGGVAHDFNNMLTVIKGHAELALMGMDEDHPVYGDLQEIRNAANRSTNIIRQLLAFARKQVIEPRILNLNDQVAHMLKMLHRLIGEDMDLVWKPGADVWEVKMDPAQIDQILLNLVVNARDAIVDVGRVVIETENVILDSAWCATHPGSIPGPYVRVTVSDTGDGMDKATLKDIFDPFFTTKEPGKGTGLGLATVYGIVKQNNGYIDVHSKPGEGTSFDVYLPRHEGASPETDPGPAVSAGAGGTETVLIVEDNPSVLEMGKRLLSRLRYTVLTTDSPKEALRLAAEYPGPIHLLVTDVVMPGMNGRDLAHRLRQSRPGMKCLFMSGYTADIIARQGVLEEGVHFIQKPFSMDRLARKVREAMGSGECIITEQRENSAR